MDAQATLSENLPPKKLSIKVLEEDPKSLQKVSIHQNPNNPPNPNTKHPHIDQDNTLRDEYSKVLDHCYPLDEILALASAQNESTSGRKLIFIEKHQNKNLLKTNVNALSTSITGAQTILKNADTLLINHHKPDQLNGIYQGLTDPALQKAVGLVHKVSEEPLINIHQKYFVEIFKSPTDTLELKLWSKVRRFEKEIHLGASKVVKGKQLGRTIGIPTANLHYPHTLVTDLHLLPGVYYGLCYFEKGLEIKRSTSGQESGQQPERIEKRAMIPVVASIGTNRQFNEGRIKYEMLILKDFGGQEFYGAELGVILQGFIRPEAKFDTFDMFVKAMECDTAVARTHIELKQVNFML